MRRFFDKLNKFTQDPPPITRKSLISQMKRLADVAGLVKNNRKESK